MAENIKRNEELVLDDSIKLNKKGEAILGVLEGPCADVINPTRNDRQYDEELWINVFNDSIVNEYFECGGILGELDHPAERTETDTSKVAICMPEKPKKNKDGKLIARFDILDTPNGRIVYTLAKYGYKLGVSSRGNGDVYEAYDGKEHVDPKTYELKAFDIVLLPAVKAARLALKESVGNKSFKQAIKECLEKANKDEKRTMVESLRKLKIDYKLEKADNKTVMTESKKVQSNSELAAEDTGAVMVKELQKFIKENKALRESLKSSQEQLSVCYAKEVKYEEEIELLKSSKIDESIINELKSEVKLLQEQLQDKEKSLARQRERYNHLSEKVNSNESQKTKLNESLSNKDSRIKALNEELILEKTKFESETKKLTEALAEEKKNSAIKVKEYTNKLVKAKSLIESYKKNADKAINRYIETKANMFGLTKEDITNRLSENYTFDDIDNICESLQSYSLAMNKLPINLTSNGNKNSNNNKIKMKVTESKESIKPNSFGFDDEVDESLLRLAGLLKN